MKDCDWNGTTGPPIGKCCLCQWRLVYVTETRPINPWKPDIYSTFGGFFINIVIIEPVYHFKYHIFINLMVPSTDMVRKTPIGSIVVSMGWKLALWHLLEHKFDCRLVLVIMVRA